jgi:hypothetical protein
MMQVDNPQWVLPSKCFNTAKLLEGQDEADVGDWSDACRAAAASTVPACAGIGQQYRCSFKSLSSFYQIQQHIRAHGAVVTRYCLVLPCYAVVWHLDMNLLQHVVSSQLRCLGTTAIMCRLTSNLQSELQLCCFSNVTCQQQLQQLTQTQG